MILFSLLFSQLFLLASADLTFKINAAIGNGANNGELASVIFEGITSSVTMLNREPLAIGDTLVTMSDAQYQNLKRILIKLDNPGTIASGAVRTLKIDMTNFALTTGVAMPPVYMLNGVEPVTFPSGSTLATVTNGFPYSIIIGKGAPVTTDCTNAAIISKTCFSLKGNVGQSVPNQNELVTIGYYDGVGNQVTVHDYFALTNTFTRFILKPAANTWISKVFVRLLDNSPSGTTERYVTVEYATFQINGTTLTQPARFLGGDALMDLKTRVFLPSPAVPATADSNEYDILLSSGAMKKTLEYTIGYPRAAVDSSLCDNAAYKSRSTCFSLKGLYGFQAALLTERVTISYQNLQGDFKTVYDNIPLNNAYERFAIVTSPGEVIQKVSIVFLNDFNSTYKTVFYQPTVYLNPASVVINGKTYTALANIIGGPVYKANSADTAKITAMLSGTLSDGGEYNLNPLAEDYRLSSAACDDTTVSNIFCFEIRAAMGSIVPTRNEVVDIQYQDTTGTIRTLVKDYPLLIATERIAVQGDPLFPIVRVIISFSGTALMDGTAWRVPHLFITPTLIFYNRVQLTSFSALLSGPGRSLCVASDLTDGKLPKPAEYYLNIPADKYNVIAGRLSSVLNTNLGFALNADPLLTPKSPSISNAGVTTELAAKAVGPLFVSPDYTLTFSIKPTATSANWTNIMQFTGDYSQCCSKNSQLPSIYMVPNSLAMNIRMSTATDGNWGFTTNPLVLNVVNYVSITAIGKTVTVTTGTATTTYVSTTSIAPSPRSFGFARLFLSSVWAPPARAVVTTVVMTPISNSLTKLVSNQLTKSVNIPLNFGVKFSFTPSATMNSVSNILQITNSNTDSLKGSRMFGAFIQPGSTVLNIQFSNTLQEDWGLDLGELNMGQVNDIVILVVDRRLRVSVNGVFTEANAPADRFSGNGNMYVSSPWYPAALGTFGNLKWVTASITAASTSDIISSNFATRLTNLFTTSGINSLPASTSTISGTSTSLRSLHSNAYSMISLQSPTTVVDAILRPIRVSADWSFKATIIPKVMNSGYATAFWIVQTDATFPAESLRAFSIGFEIPATGVTTFVKAKIHFRTSSGAESRVLTETLPLNQPATIEVTAVGRSIAVSINGVDEMYPLSGNRILGDAFLRFPVNISGVESANADIRSLELKPVDTTSSTESIISKNNFEGDVVVPANYELTFNLFIRSIPTTKVNILHYTVTGSDTSRIPAIFLNAGTTDMVICFSTQKKWDFQFRPLQLPLLTDIKVKITTLGRSVNVFYNEYHDVMFLDSFRIGGFAQLFTSNPFLPAAPAILKNLEMKSYGFSSYNSQALLAPNTGGQYVIPLNYEIRFVVYPTGTTASMGNIFLLGNPGTIVGAFFQSGTTKLRVITPLKTGTTIATNEMLDTTSLPINQTTVVTVTLDGTSVTLKLNGTFAKSMTQTGTRTTHHWSVLFTSGRGIPAAKARVMDWSFTDLSTPAIATATSATGIPDGYIVETGRTYSDTTLATTTGTLAACATSCNNNVNCVGFTYIATPPTCALKSTLLLGAESTTTATYREINRKGRSYVPMTLANYAPELSQASYIRYELPADSALTKKVAFGLNGFGKFEFVVNGLSIRQGLPAVNTLTSGNDPCDVTRSFDYISITSSGELMVKEGDGDTCFMGRNTIGPGRFMFELAKETSTSFSVYVTDGQSSYTLFTLVLPMKMFAHSLVFGYTGNYDAIPGYLTANKAVTIFSLDGAWNSWSDISTGLSSAVVQSAPFGLDTATTIVPDANRHATEMALLLKSSVFGLFKSATLNLEVVKITSWYSNQFSEQQLLTGMEYVINKVVTTGTTKIMNIAASPFRNIHSDRVNCMIEIAYKQGIYVLFGAGNGGIKAGASNPFALRVGAVCQTKGVVQPCALSNFGDEIDLWAPGYTFDSLIMGTSYAVTFASAVLALEIQKFTTLPTTPAQGFTALLNDGTPFATPKTAFNSKLLKYSTGAAVTTGAVEPAASYCGKYGGAITGIMDSLVTDASNSDDYGYLVIDAGGEGTCGGRMFPCEDEE